MEKETAEVQSAPEASKQRLETALIWILPIFIVIALAFTAFLIWQAFFFDPPENPPQGEETTTTAPAPDDGGEKPKPSVPVFSGGILPTPPTVTADTVALSGEVSSRYAVLIDAESGLILAGKDFDVKFSPASMTKVMTLIVACENLTDEQLQSRVTVPADLNAYVTTGAYKGTDNARFDVYDRVKVEDLLYGISMESFSDCAILIAALICPAETFEESERLFVELMNQKALQLGLQNTHFDNVVGHESAENYSTAADVAQITAYALQSGMIRSLLSEDMQQFYIGYTKADGTDTEYRYTYFSTLFNSNPDPKSRSRIKSYEEKYGTFALKQGLRFCGGKTGTLGDAASGYIYSLVSYVTVGDKTYIAVTGETTLSYGVIKDAKMLYDNYIP